MAIAFRASGAVATGTTSLSIAQPTGTTTGDVLVAFVVDHSVSNANSTAPTGWTAKALAWASGTRFQVFTAVVGQNGLTGTSWSFTGLTTRAVGFMQGFSGGSTDFAHQPDVSASVRVNASGTTGTLGITPGNNGDMVIAGFCAFASGSTWSSQAVATAPTLSNAGGGANSTFCSVSAASGILATAAPTGASSATMGTAGANAAILLSIKAPTSATATPSGVASTSTEDNPLGGPASLPSGVSATSTGNNGIGEPIALASGASSTSAENNPTASAGWTATPSGVAATSAEANPLGEPTALPSGTSSTSAENNPSANGTGIATAAGTSAISAESNPLGEPVSLASGVSAVSATAAPLGEPSALPSGRAATTAENNPLALTSALPSGLSLVATQNAPGGEDTALPAGRSVTSTENDPLAVAAGLASGQSLIASATGPDAWTSGNPAGLALVAAENNPTANGGGAVQDGTAVPEGVVATSAVGQCIKASDPIVLGGGIAWTSLPLSTRHWSAPLSSKLKVEAEEQAATTAVAVPFGLSLQIRGGAILPLTSGRCSPHGEELCIRNGRLIAGASATVKLPCAAARRPPLEADLGRFRARGVINPTDEELLMILAEVA